MKNLQIRTKRSLSFLGLDPTHNGYNQLVDCVLVQAEHRYPYIGSVYSFVALKYEIQYKSVMRNISYALGKVDNLCDRLSELLGFTVDDSLLHNGSIINYLADFVSFPELYNFSA